MYDPLCWVCSQSNGGQSIRMGANLSGPVYYNGSSIHPMDPQVGPAARAHQAIRIITVIKKCNSLLSFKILSVFLMTFSFFEILENIMILLNSTFHENMVIFFKGQKEKKKERCCTGLCRSANHIHWIIVLAGWTPTIDHYSDPPRPRIPLCGAHSNFCGSINRTQHDNTTENGKLRTCSSHGLSLPCALILPSING